MPTLTVQAEAAAHPLRFNALKRGLDRAMAGHPRTLRIRCAASSESAPLLATVEYLAGYPCLWIACFDFCGEPTAALLHALRRCRQSGKVDEIECCLRHAREPGRSLWMDGLVDEGFASTGNGQ